MATWSKDPADAGKKYAFSPQPDNYRDFYSNGNTLTNSIALTGGTEKTQVYFSYTNVAAKGIVDNKKYKWRWRQWQGFRLYKQQQIPQVWLRVFLNWVGPTNRIQRFGGINKPYAD